MVQETALLLNHTDLGPGAGWVTLNKSLSLTQGLSFLICEMGTSTSHRTGVRIRDKVSVQNACHTADFELMAALITSIITMEFLEALSLKLLFCDQSYPLAQLTAFGHDFNSLSYKPRWINDTSQNRGV